MDTAHLRPIGVRLTPDGRVPVPARITPRGDPLILTRGVPTDIAVHNALAEPTSIHWHGLELESYSDGVAGLSGDGARRAPAIAPGDSFVAHLTLKRAGTFIYHTHLNDLYQIATGLYGPIIVLEPGQRWDPTRDLVLTAGFDISRANGPVVNGGESDPPLELPVGQTVRLRFINIAPADPVTFELRRDTTVVQWRSVAKDGFTLPAAQARMEHATRSLWVGETFDAEFTPRDAGTYHLRVRSGPKDILYDRELRVSAPSALPKRSGQP
jgi:manganese oxidase